MTRPPAPLDDRDAELLRDLRSRLNRLPPAPAARLVLFGAFLKACARVGLEPRPGAPSNPVTIQMVENAAGHADLDQLRSLVSVLDAIHNEHGPAFLALMASGAGQAVLSRRLALAGREGRNGADAA